MLIYAREHGDLATISDVEEIAEQPFNSTSKRAITATDDGSGPQAYLKGARSCSRDVRQGRAEREGISADT